MSGADICDVATEYFTHDSDSESRPNATNHCLRKHVTLTSQWITMSMGSYRTLEGVMKSANIVSDLGPFLINVTFPLLQFVVYVVKFTASGFH